MKIKEFICYINKLMDKYFKGTTMIKYLITTLLLLSGCAQVNDWNEQPPYSEVVQPAPPTKENPVYEVPTWSHFELKHDALEFLLENPPMDLQHIYQIQWCDKWIAERVKERLIYEELEMKEKK